MRITQVKLQPGANVSPITLSLRDPNRIQPYSVRSITGLDADEIVARFYGSGGADRFYNLAMQSREIAMRISLNPRPNTGETFSSLRDDIYRLISSSRNGVLELQFKDDSAITAKITGFITKVENALFEKSPEVQVTVKCDDPFLRGPDYISVMTPGTPPVATYLEDPYSTAPHGIRFEMKFVDDVESFHMHGADWSFEVVPDSGFESGDVLYVSSELNDKYIYIRRPVLSAWEVINLGDKVVPGSMWPLLFPGWSNPMLVDDPTSMEWNKIEWRPTYWGV